MGCLIAIILVIVAFTSGVWAAVGVGLLMGLIAGFLSD